MDVRHFLWFSDLIKAIRRQHGLSQRGLAKTLQVSPGYIGQWELKLSQPSPEVAGRLCQIFLIEDVEYVQRLAFAQRAPDWLRESIVFYQREPDPQLPLSPREHRLLKALRKLPETQAENLTNKVEGWVEALLDDGRRPPSNSR